VKALAAIALTLAFATPASAATVPHRAPPEVGPVFAGDSVMWGEPSSRGASLVMMGAPGRAPVLVHRVAPATAHETERSFSGRKSAFAASATGFAALYTTATVVFAESDSVTIATTEAALAGPFHGPVGTVAGCFPRRGDEGCPPSCGTADGVDVDGSRTAVTLETWSCTPDGKPGRFSIAVRDGATTTTVPVGAVQSVNDLALSGRYLAWTASSHRAWDALVVWDLVGGAEVTRVRARDLDARFMYDVAVEADGTVAFKFSGRGAARASRLGVIVPGTPGVRVVDDHIAGALEMAGGRLLYERQPSVDSVRTELVLRSLAGGPPTVLARFTERVRRIGDIDLDATRATWAWVRSRDSYDVIPRGPGRIVVRGL
jgi:hypothetical protein